MCCPNQTYNFPDIILNLSEADPMDSSERELYEEVMPIISKTPELIQLVSEYGGCDEVIRHALSNPGNSEIESRAFDSVFDAVELLERFFSFALELDIIWPKLLKSICTDNSLEAIGNRQATIKMIGELFKFVFMFDNEKMMHPSIQNDFSYYRRVYNKIKQIKKKEKRR